MGSATTQALAASVAAVEAATGIDRATADELFAVARALGDAPQLSGALADWSAAPEARTKVVSDVFGASVGVKARELLVAIVTQRWSSADDLVDGVEEVAIRSAARTQPDADVEGELFRFGRTVAAHPELELALGSRLGEASVKGSLVEALLKGRVSDATTLIVSALVQQPRGRRVRRLLGRAEQIVAAQRGRKVATVFTAVPLTPAQSSRLSAVLARRYDSEVAINSVVDPTVIGGLRVQIADDVIDVSVSSRLADLRLKLAG